MPPPIIGRQPPSELADALVLRPDGTSVRLGELWTGSATLLVFLRHFGCMGCDQHVHELSPRLLELHRLGLRTIFIGNGEPRYLAGFIERHVLQDKKVEVVTDPSLRAFHAMHLIRSWWATLGPRALVGFVKAFFAGHRQTWLMGDGSQQGGTLLIDRNGEVAYYYCNTHLGDRAPTVEVVDVALRLLMDRGSSLT